MQKTLLIFIGGTGLSAARELRRLIVERYPQGLQADEVSSLRFLWIDTNDEDLERFSWNVLGKDISLKEGEKVIITGDRLGGLIEHRENYPNVAQWLPEIKTYIGDPGPGAKGIRPYGRLIFEFSENQERVKNKCLAAYNSLNEAFPGLNEWRIYIVAGASGGTGSGMFLPFLWSLTDWNIYQSGNQNRKLYSFLVLPSLVAIGRHDRYLANAYALGRELNYFAFASKLPLNNCYLLEPRNAEGLEVILESLPLLIAQRIFLNIQDGAAASITAATMDNPNLGNVLEDEDDIYTRRRHSRQFSTFGLATVSYPREIVARSLAGYFAKYIVSSWLEERVFPKNTVDLVNQELGNIRFSFAYICGDSDPFGLNDYKNFDVELNDLVDAAFQGVGKKQLGNTLHKIQRNIAATFRDLGIENFYKRRRGNVEGAIQQSLEALRIKITDFLRTPDRGLSYAKQFLDTLLKILQEYQSKVSSMASDDTQQKLKIFQKNLSETINFTLNREQGFFYGNRAFKEDLTNASDELKQYLKQLARIEAGKYGTLFLDGAIPRVQELRNELDDWQNRAIDTCDSLASRFETTLKGQAFEYTENGVSVFNQKILDELIETLNLDFVQTSIEEVIRTILNQPTLDLIGLMRQTNISELIYQAAYKWVLSEKCTISPQLLTLYDQFIDAYSSSKERQTILSSALTRSSPFLRFSNEETGKSNTLYEESIIVTVPNNIGLAITDGRPAQAAIKEDLQAIGIPNQLIAESPDTERIVFLKERQAFPLRFIESFDKYKQDYDRVQNRAVLHIDRTLESHLYDLYILTAEEKRSLLEAQETFVLARSHIWITYEINQRTRQAEVRYQFEEVGLLGVQKLILGSDWEIAMEVFVQTALTPKETSSPIHQARQKLTERTQQLRKDAVRNMDVLDEVKSRLDAHLRLQAEQSPEGTDSEIYERDRTIVNRIIQSLK